MKPQIATGYLGGRLQQIADDAYVQNGRWMTSENSSLEDAIKNLFAKEPLERKSGKSPINMLIPPKPIRSKPLFFRLFHIWRH